MRSKILTKILSEMKDKPYKKRDKISLAFQLGYWVGKYLMKRQVPTLSIDMLKSGVVIQVTCAEGDAYRKLENDWFNEKDVTKKTVLWNNLRNSWKTLADKYLPNVFVCNIDFIDIEDGDLPEFKKGISLALWASDCCHYSVDVDKIKFISKDCWSEIKLFLEHDV